ncbi:MAG: hypothetical protein JNL90_03325 [Planctomycetes bacterium]|nr:hypothetical protein [Planctomycetota bacterium]
MARRTHGSSAPRRQRSLRRHLLLLSSAALAAGCWQKSSHSDSPIEAQGDTGVIAGHLNQRALELGRVPTETVLDAGELLFAGMFNELDGAMRPETTGTGVARNRRDGTQKMNRISGPDANSCAGCHNVPRIGGGGDNVANVFVLGQRFEFVNFDGGVGDGNQTHTLQEVANERNTLGMFGAGFIELLAREMTTELQAIRADAIAQADLAGSDVTLPLVAKGVDFGSITAHSDGSLDTSAVDGVDANLVIKPFHQKGVVTSLREFTNNAMNHHHGMQSSERFGAGVDADADGMVDELTAGDITAATLWQATLPAPGQVLPGPSGAELDAVLEGEQLFTTVGCADCHVPELTLESPLFSEPNPFNPTGNLQLVDVIDPVVVDLTVVGDGPHLPRESDGSVKVRAFTDLKRHDMGPGLAEPLVQAGVAGNLFLTKKLWGMSNEPPFMHHGRATTIDEAIRMHGGEGDAARTAYEALAADDQKKVVEFLKTLQLLPEDATSPVVVGAPSGTIGDEPALAGGHLDQDDIDAGLYTPEALFALGKVGFNAFFNTLDGQGRPTTTGTGASRSSHVAPENFNRISAPDANSCAGCHNLPRSGGGGDNVANVFVLGQRFPFLRFDGGLDDLSLTPTLEQAANERNTLGMWGAGFIELLSREMSTELIALRDAAIAQAANDGVDVTVELDTKGVNFGSLTALAAGGVDTSGVVGVNSDLIVRPFHQKGVVVSLREFTNNAMNHHHGMQPSERFGDGVDHDSDGVLDELSRGDITATTLYQALLPVPGRVLPADGKRRRAVARGERLFESLGCATCHVPELTLDSPLFSEPNPFNPAGNLQVADVPAPYEVDLTAHGPGPRLPAETDGSVKVPAYTDLKRHDMGAELDNETLVQGGVPTSWFLTKKLWGFASEPPYMHHGRALTIADAILMHGGEAQPARDAYAALSATDAACLIDFLKTLQVMPENGPLESVEGE